MSIRVFDTAILKEATVACFATLLVYIRLWVCYPYLKNFIPFGSEPL